MSEVSSTWRRARQPEQREQRRQDILRAAAILFQKAGVAGTSLTSIAKEVGLSKSNLYRYFESREDIFLAILEQDYESWCSAAEKRLEKLGPDADHKEVARILMETSVASPRLCALLTALPSVLEQNISTEVYSRFKRVSSLLSDRMCKALHLVLPALSFDEAFLLQRYLHAFVTGIWPVANPPPNLAPVLERKEFQRFQMDFASELECVLERLLRSMISE